MLVPRHEHRHGPGLVQNGAELVAGRGQTGAVVWTGGHKIPLLSPPQYIHRLAQHRQLCSSWVNEVRPSCTLPGSRQVPVWIRRRLAAAVATMVEVAPCLGFSDPGRSGSAVCYTCRPAPIGLPEWPAQLHHQGSVVRYQHVFNIIS